jgi:hypothetical protein
MKVFQDIFTNDEVLSDVYTQISDYNDVIMKVQTAFKSKEAVGNVDIGCGNAFGGEEETGGDEAPQEKVNDVQYNFSLEEAQFSKGDFMTYIKTYLGKLKESLTANGADADKLAAFQTGAQNFIKFVVGKFDEFQFYTGISESLEGGLIFSFWEDESASGPVFYYFKDGYRQQKC